MQSKSRFLFRERLFFSFALYVVNYPNAKVSGLRASSPNGISPDSVKDCPSSKSCKDEIEDVLGSVGCIVGWNVSFDLRMLYANGIDLSFDNDRYCDLMPAYCKKRSSIEKGYNRKCEDTLESAVDYLGLSHKNAHTDLAGASVLIPMWNWMASQAALKQEGRITFPHSSS